MTPSSSSDDVPQNYYRSNKVPNPFAGVRPRSFFSRGGDGPPPVAPRPQAQPASNPYRYSATTDNAPPRFTSHSYHQAHDSNSGASPNHHHFPYGAYRSNRPPQPPPSSTRFRLLHLLNNRDHIARKSRGLPPGLTLHLNIDHRREPSQIPLHQLLPKDNVRHRLLLKRLHLRQCRLSINYLL